MSRRTSVRSANTIVVLLLIACSWGARAATAAKPASAAANGTEQAKLQTVLIKGFKFEPETVTVNVGDTVEWKNADIVPHTATAAGEFDSKNIRPGGAWKFVAKHKGRFNYICTLHPNMKGKLMVQ